MLTILILLALFQLKHFLADYPLQNGYMLQKFKPTGWAKPLAAHAGVHAAFTFAIAIFFVTPLFALALAGLDFAVHFTMDRIKASPNLLGRFKSLSAGDFGAFDAAEKEYVTTPERAEHFASFKSRLLRENKYFWWSLGLDQAVHHLTHYAIIFLMLA